MTGLPASADDARAVEIRRVSPDDAAAIRALYVGLLHETFRWFPAEGRAAFEQDWTTELLTSRSADARRVLLAAFRTSGEPVGYMFGAPDEAGVATIIWLAVAPDCQGQGIGRRLFDEAAAGYRKLGSHKIRLYASTPGSIDFYRRVGMIVEGEHRRHWWGVDCWSLAMFI